MARLIDRLQPVNMTQRGIQTWAQRACEQIEGALADTTSQGADIAALETDLAAAVLDFALITSYVIPGTMLGATDAGATATIGVLGHRRRYGDGTELAAVTAGNITGLSFSTKYYVYYDDTTRANANPTFLATTNPNTAAPSKATGRHFCGVITTPANGAADTTGGMAPPWGGGLILYGDIGSTP